MALKANIYVDQGSSFIDGIELLDENDEAVITTGLTASGKIKRHFESANSVSFTTTLSNGLLLISLTSAQTSAMKPGRYMYDIEMSDSSLNVTRIIEGILTLSPEVSN